MRKSAFCRAALALVVATLAPSLLWAQALPSWLDPAVSPQANADRAQREGVPAGDATRELFRSGTRSDVAAQSVIRSYGTCEAVGQAVAAAVEVDPAHAAETANAAASVEKCPCSGENVWAKTRMEQRIRIERRDKPFQIAPMCGCVAMIAQAAATAAPNDADRILTATLGARQRASAVVDSLGQIGSPRGPDAGNGAILGRNDDHRCDRDTAPDDEFSAQHNGWTAVDRTQLLDPAGTGAARCGGDDGKKAASADALLIAGYVSGSESRALVLDNPTDHEVNLADERYQLEVYFPGSREPGRRVPLSGKVAAGGRFVLTDPQVDAALRKRANQVTPLANFGANDSLVLRRGGNDSDCECTRAAVASVANGLDSSGGGSAWLQETGAKAAGVMGTESMDRVGQVRPENNDRAQWTAPLAGAPQTLLRDDPRCSGDRLPESTFDPAKGWQSADWSGAAVLSCSTTPDGLLVAGYRAEQGDGDTPYRVVDIANRTGAPVDLAAQGYILDVYTDGARTPSRSIPLKGELDDAQNFAVASDNAPDALKRDARQVDAALSQPRLDAVVLRRMATSSGMLCPAEVYAAVREVGLPPIVIATAPPLTVDGEPTTDESVIDPNRGGDLASPN